MIILSIDVGSSSVRAALFDEDACLIADSVSSQSYQFDTDSSGAVTIAAERLRRMVEQCIDNTLLHPRASELAGVAMATFVGNLLGLDASWQPVTPVFTYADTRAAPDAEALKNTLSPFDIHQRTGCPLHSAYLPARFAWLSRQAKTAATQWVDFATWLYMTWFGRLVPCSYSIATWSGLCNRFTLEWDQECLAMSGVADAMLPMLADYNTTQTGLSVAYAQRWPALKDVPFFLAVGDGAAANLGSGCTSPQHIALTLGTTAALRMVTEQTLTPLPAGLWNYKVTRDLNLIGGATTEGGSIFQWARSTLSLEASEALDAALSARPADIHGLTVLPLLAGERSPGWRADATGNIVGLRLSTTPLDILQALLESVALRLAIIFDQLLPFASTDAAIMAAGGAVQASPAWAQIITNALNRPVHLITEPEMTLRGVTLLALNALAKAPLFKPARTTQCLLPQVEAVQRLREAGARQQALYRLMFT